MNRINKNVSNYVRKFRKSDILNIVLTNQVYFLNLTSEHPLALRRKQHDTEWNAETLTQSVQSDISLALYQLKSANTTKRSKSIFFRWIPLSSG